MPRTFLPVLVAGALAAVPVPAQDLTDLARLVPRDDDNVLLIGDPLPHVRRMLTAPWRWNAGWRTPVRRGGIRAPWSDCP